MNKYSEKLRGVLLVGSAPVSDAEEMFVMAIRHLNGYIKRLPDGEFGERDTWIRFQYARLLEAPQLTPSGEKPVYTPVSPISTINGISLASQISIPNLGYADAAINSYAVFKQMKNNGAIPINIRFQIGLPTPYSVATMYGHINIQEILEEAYKKALENELTKILGAIPHEELAIQWETVTEFAVLENIVNSYINEDKMNQLTRRVSKLVDMLPNQVEAGIHLCYGDSGHKHFCEPMDSSYLVDFANGVASHAKRTIEWLHLPVPKERADIEYYKPLSRLNLDNNTELYLGLVHMTGGLEGTKERVDAALGFVKHFGISTECGLGRRSKETIPDLLNQHRALVEI
ncbi:MAG: hypothetical protein VX617_01320 [Pseudomonadota bacterium]|nr:hypothetical protein [Pseudomonadota bacterium]